MDAVDAGRLFTLATQFAAVPRKTGQSAEYRRLVERYLNESVFRSLVDQIFEGAQCEVTHASTTEGLIVLVDPDSPWCWPTSAADLPWNKKLKGPRSQFERAARMLVIPALLAYIAPTSADLDDLLSDPTLVPPPVTVRDLEAFIRSYAKEQEEQNPHLPDGEYSLWWHWLQCSPENTGGHIGRTTTGFIVHEVLQFLRDLGLLSKSHGSSLSASYQVRRGLLFHYRDLLIDELLTSLRASAATRDDQDDPQHAANDNERTGD